MSPELLALMRQRDNWQLTASVCASAMSGALANAEGFKRQALEAQDEVRKLDMRIEALSRADPGS